MDYPPKMDWSTWTSNVFSSWHVWKLFWLFWLFGVVEILITFPSFIQSLRQIIGVVVADINNKPMPDKDNYVPKVKYSLPFEGEWVVVNGGVTKDSSHSWEINSQRYAYDFIHLDDEGKSYHGDESRLSSYYCYGSEVLEPADGVVVELRNNCKDSKILGNGNIDPFVRDIRGNYVLIRHTDDEFSCLAHLAPESISVGVGQKVKRKEPIALCGNSGNTSEPHVHFQVQNGKSFYHAAGLPIRFQDIEAVLQPKYDTYDSRPIPTPSENFISRGQRVVNLSPNFQAQR